MRDACAEALAAPEGVSRDAVAVRGAGDINLDLIQIQIQIQILDLFWNWLSLCCGSCGWSWCVVLYVLVSVHPVLQKGWGCLLACD